MDGFYWLLLQPEDTHQLAVLFPTPTHPNKPKLVGIPLENPIGWVSLPPNFLAATETIAGLANAALSCPNVVAAAHQALHCFDVLSESNQNLDTTRPDINDLNTLTTTSQSAFNLDSILDAIFMQKKLSIQVFPQIQNCQVTQAVPRLCQLFPTQTHQVPQVVPRPHPLFSTKTYQVTQVVPEFCQLFPTQNCQVTQVVPSLSAFLNTKLPSHSSGSRTLSVDTSSNNLKKLLR